MTADPSHHKDWESFGALERWALPGKPSPGFTCRHIGRLPDNCATWRGA